MEKRTCARWSGSAEGWWGGFSISLANLPLWAAESERIPRARAGPGRALSRREFLALGGRLGWVCLLAAGLGELGSGRPARAEVPLVATDLELVTVTDTSFVLTWFTGDLRERDAYGRPRPVAADTTVYFGASPDPASWEKVVVEEETPYHYAEITGLEPGKRYYYRAESRGVPALPAAQPYPELPATGTVVTLVPPPGRPVFTLAIMNDLHFGEAVSGLAVSDPVQFPPGFPADPSDPYWRFMTAAALREARERGAEVLLVNGDLTNEAEPEFVREVKRVLDGAFGPYRLGYFVTRGNHDRAHSGRSSTGTPYSSCRTRVGGAYDCFADLFFPDGRSFFSWVHRGLRIIGLDSVDITSGWTSGRGRLDQNGQLEWLEAELAKEPNAPTLIFFHHPVTEEASATAVPPVVFTVDQRDALRFEEILRGSPVLAVFHGHTHRCWVTTSPLTGSLPYVEVGAAKEYPGGYGLLPVYEGGAMFNFFKTREPKARAWSWRSRGEYLGLYPYYTLGRLADRNFTLTFPEGIRVRPGPGHSRPGGEAFARPAQSSLGPRASLPATGAAAGLLGAAGASLVGLGRVLRSRSSPGEAEQTPGGDEEGGI